MAAAGLPDGFHEAAADVYDRAARRSADGNGARPRAAGNLDAVLAALMPRRAGSGA
jgi:hypothetical protein